MEKEKYNKIFIEKDFKEDCVQQLHKMGFLIDDDFDELAALEELRIKGMSDPVQNVTLLTTTECNARCYYCFENGIKQYPMTKKVADATIQYIIKNYPEPQFAINWFGGEPLMNFEIMKYITEELKKAGYDLIAHITTNGSLLTEEMLEYFQKEYSDLSFQITIDEIGEKYGKIKRYVDIDAKDAYKRVINNVCMLLDHHVTTNVRLNFAASKIERAKEIYIQLKKEFEGHDNSSLYIYFAPLTLDSDNEIISDFHGDTKTYNQLSGREIISTPKTPSSVRKVSMPAFLVDELKEYIGLLYEPKEDQRIFQISKSKINSNFHKLSDQAGLKRITIHGLRHSHVSLLISKKYDIFEVSKRIGHKSVKTTQDIYGHLFDDVQKSIANDLNMIRRGGV